MLLLTKKGTFISEIAFLDAVFTLRVFPLSLNIVDAIEETFKNRHMQHNKIASLSSATVECVKTLDLNSISKKDILC